MTATRPGQQAVTVTTVPGGLRHYGARSVRIDGVECAVVMRHLHRPARWQLHTLDRPARTYRTRAEAIASARAQIDAGTLAAPAPDDPAAARRRHRR